MPRYDFGELTDYDFESLSRDLLERHLSLILELFTPGIDQGIDLRHLSPNGDRNELIVQCKRYDAKAWAALRTNLKKQELSKIKALDPARYIVITSVNMTPSRKQTLVTDLAPWLKT